MAGDIRILQQDATVFLVPAETGYRAESGRAKYAAGHVPGCAFMDLIETFADTSTGLGFSLPSAGKLQDGFRSIGINDDSRIVFYSTGDSRALSHQSRRLAR